MRIRLTIIIILVLAPVYIWAQPDHPTNGSIHGVIYLLLAGLGFAFYRLKGEKKSAN